MDKNFKQLLLIFFLLLIMSYSYASNIDSLIGQLNNVQGKEKTELLLTITWKLRNTNPQEGIKYCKQAIRLADSTKDYANAAKAYSFLGVLYRNLGYYSIAFSYYKKGLDIAVKHNILDQEGYGYNNLGNIYLYQKQPELAIKYLKKADSLAQIMKNDDVRAYALQNIGRAFMMLGQADSAIKYLNLALEVREKINAVNKIPVTYKYLGDAYKLKGDYKSAFKYYDLTASSADFENDMDLYADYSYNMADLYLKTNRLDSALWYAQQSIKAAKKVNTLYREMLAYEILAKVYAQKKDYKKAYDYSLEALKIKDQIFTEEVVKGVKSIEFTEQAAKKDAKIKLLEKDLKIKALENKRRTYLLYTAAVILLAMIILAIAISAQNVKIKKYARELAEKNEIINQQNEELQQHSNNLKAINEELAEKDMTITQSIEYAKTIKQSMMSSEAALQECPVVRDYFIIDKPKDIIGGDFYYFNRFKDYTSIIVADATGHGIPGAFISIISIAIFKDILHSLENPDAAQVLTIFRARIKSVLRQDQKRFNVKDGVDVAICLIYPQRNILNFAGAYQDLYYINQGELSVVKGVKNTAGFSFVEKEFLSHNIYLENIDKFYLFSDGVVDQLGGEDYTRFSTQRWQNLLLEIHRYPMKKQKEIIEQIIEKWKDNNRQTDDILIVGIELDKSVLM